MLVIIQPLLLSKLTKENYKTQNSEYPPLAASCSRRFKLKKKSTPVVSRKRKKATKTTHQFSIRSLACSTLVPCRRMTIGFFMPIDLAALITPVAITSHLMMPPKMFTKIVATYIHDDKRDTEYKKFSKRTAKSVGEGERRHLHEMIIQGAQNSENTQKKCGSG